MNIVQARIQRDNFVNLDISNIPKEPGVAFGIVYSIVDTLHNKMYIGSTMNFPERAASYLRKYRNPNNKSTIQPIHKAMIDYGIENFKMQPICQCNSESSLRKTEEEYIQKYNTLEPNGYNILYSGNGTIPDADTRRRKSRPIIAINMEDLIVYFSDSASLVAQVVFNNVDRSIIISSTKKGIKFHGYYFFYIAPSEIQDAINRKLMQYELGLGKRNGCIPGRDKEYAILGNSFLTEGLNFFRNNGFKMYQLKFSDTTSERYEITELS